jgi:hypothetical protein
VAAGDGRRGRLATQVREDVREILVGHGPQHAGAHADGTAAVALDGEEDQAREFLVAVERDDLRKGRRRDAVDAFDDVRAAVSA